MASVWAATRIRKQREFREIFRKGRRMRGSRLTLIRMNGSMQSDRLAVVVTKKTGSAVVRNRWKRIARAEFASYCLGGQDRSDYLVLVHRETAGKPTPADRQELAKFFRRQSTNRK